MLRVTRAHVAGACGTVCYVIRFDDRQPRGISFSVWLLMSAHVRAPPFIHPTMQPGATSTPVLFVRRVHYLAHPRHNGKIVRRLDNEDEIVQALETQTAGGEAGVSLLNGLFSSMTMKEQVEMAQAACVMSGAHGAGLSHILFAPPGVHMLELQPPAFRRPHFVSYSYWTGAHHHNWLLDSSTPDVHQVVARVLETAQHAAVEAKAAGDGEAVPRGDHPMHIGNEH